MRAFRVAYDGVEYRGFQRQPHGETIEDTLFDALRELDVGFQDGSPLGYAAAGRTDAGVSAREQTIALETPTWLTPRALNSELPASIRAWAVADVPDSFHATHDAIERTYRYVLYAPDCDDGLARKAAKKLSGAHDFHNFTPDDDGTERELSVSVRRDRSFLVIDCRAGGFARQLVRRVVSMLDAVARGDREPAAIDRALSSEPLSGPAGIAPAAPEPLVLLAVRYPETTFDIDDRALEATRRIFEERRRQRLVGARVAGELTPGRLSE
jgi:tRNA pseudouridine38-40 synthase